jgi:hypothetical protein
MRFDLTGKEMPIDIRQAHSYLVANYQMLSAVTAER